MESGCWQIKCGMGVEAIARCGSFDRMSIERGAGGYFHGGC